MLASCSKGHSTCFHVINSPTCLASSRNFCEDKKMYPGTKLGLYILKNRGHKL